MNGSLPESSSNRPMVNAHPAYPLLRQAVERLCLAGIPFAPPTEIVEWNGDARHGRFVRLDAVTCALHVGRGCYITLDVQRDLNGVIPDEALLCVLCRSGNVREPDSRRSHNLV